MVMLKAQNPSRDALALFDRGLICPWFLSSDIDKALGVRAKLLTLIRTGWLLLMVGLLRLWRSFVIILLFTGNYISSLYLRSYVFMALVSTENEGLFNLNPYPPSPHLPIETPKICLITQRPRRPSRGAAHQCMLARAAARDCTGAGPELRV